MLFIILFLSSCISLASASDIPTIEMEEGRVIHRQTEPSSRPDNFSLRINSAKVEPHTMEAQAQAHVPSYKARIITALPFFITGMGAILSISAILKSDPPLNQQTLYFMSDSFWLAASITGVTIKFLGF